MNPNTEYYSFKKLLIFGDENVGKTAFKVCLESGSTDKFNEEYAKSDQDITMSKILVKFHRESKEHQMPLNLFQIKLGNKLPSKSLLDSLFYECQCALFFIDITNSFSIEKIKKLVEIIKQAKLFRKYPDLVTYLVSNKCDLENNRLISGYEIKEFSDNNIELKHVELSLKTPKDSFNKLVDLIYLAQNDSKHKIGMNLVSISQNEIFSIQNTIRIVLLGDSGVGKTAIMNRHFRNEFSEVFLSTIGIDDKTEIVKIRKNDIYKLQIWDTAGQERFRCLPRKYYQNADGILLIFSVDLEDSFKNVEKWMTEIKANANRAVAGGSENLNEKSTTIYIIGNKCDLENRKVTKEEGEELAKRYNTEYVEVSSKLNINIDETLSKMVLSCYSKCTGVKDCFNLNEMPKDSTPKKKCC